MTRTATRPLVTAAVTTLCLLGVSGCGGGGEDEADTAKQNIESSLLEEEDGLTGTQVTKEQAGCLSDGMVDDIGVEKLQEYGVLTEDLKIDENGTPDDMSAEDADSLAAVITDCIDVSDFLGEQLGGGAGQLTDDQQQCIADSIDVDAFESLLSDTFQGEEPDPSKLMGGAMDCLAAS